MAEPKYPKGERVWVGYYNAEHVSKERLGQYITTLSEEYMKQVAEANLLATGAIAYLDIEALLAVWKKAAALNAVVPA